MLECRGNAIGDPGQDLVLVGDVLVQRHRLDAEALAETAHRERTQAVAVGKLDGGIEDPVAIERHAGWLPQLELLRLDRLTP